MCGAMTPVSLCFCQQLVFASCYRVPQYKCCTGFSANIVEATKVQTLALQKAFVTEYGYSSQHMSCLACMHGLEYDYQMLIHMFLQHNCGRVTPICIIRWHSNARRLRIAFAIHSISKGMPQRLVQVTG
ncbi:hypothetical protein ABBQ38_013979 [Trebouxia sp. C0009 RCD-2024]